LLCFLLCVFERFVLGQVINIRFQVAFHLSANGHNFPTTQHGCGLIIIFIATFKLGFFF